MGLTIWMRIFGLPVSEPCHCGLKRQPINFGATFVADDINFDGYQELSVIS